MQEQEAQRESLVSVSVCGFICRTFSVLEPLACRQSSVGGVICIQEACLWAVILSPWGDCRA